MKQNPSSSTTFQEFKVKSNQLVDKIRDIVEEGNARRIIVKKGGRTVVEFPMSVGVGGATAAVFLAPHLAAAGAIAAHLLSDISIVVEREIPTAELIEPEGADAPDAPPDAPPV